MNDKVRIVDTPHGPIADRRAQAPTSATNGFDTNLLNYFVGQFSVITTKLEQVHEDMLAQKNAHTAMQGDIDEIKRAFPKHENGEDPDYFGHHDHHDKLIKTSKRWSEIGTDVLKKVFGGVTWIVLVFIALAVWNEIMNRLHLVAGNLPPPK